MASSSHLQAAASQFPQFHFQRSAVTATDLNSPSYLTLLASYPIPQPAQEALSLSKPLPHKIQRGSCGHNLIAAVSSDAIIKLYNYSNAQPGRQASIQHFAQLAGHTGPIHDIKFHNVHGSYDTAEVETAPGGACMLSSCSQDGTVRFWDVRQQQPALTMRHPKNKPFFACASAGNLLAAGSGPFFFLWDLRTSKLLAENEEFHTEDINQIAFHPLNPGTIFTGAEDGLICELNPEAGSDQDDWLMNVINIENPVSRFGFFGPKAEYIWALSCVETLSLWHIEECNRISDFAQIRDNLTKSANMPIDYLIDAHYDQKSQRVFLATGCNNGELVLSHVNKTEIQPFCLAHVAVKPTPAAAPAAAAASSSSAASLVSPVTGFSLQPLQSSPFDQTAMNAIDVANNVAMDEDEDAPDFLKDGEVIMNAGDVDMNGGAESEPARPPIDPTAQGHTATIRDVLWYENVLITGGEDSRICLWSTDATAQAAVSGAADLKAKEHAPKPASSTTPGKSTKGTRQYNPY